MSEVENTTAPVVTEAVPATDATVVAPAVAEPAVLSEPSTAEATEEGKTDAAPAAAEETAPVEEKAIEPVTEGQLAYKGPGLVKSLIATKKEFWLSDDAVLPENLDLFLRGEKPEIAHPIAAWASQTGKGLLFFNKKGDTDRTHPHSVLDLYNATDLKKESAHQFAFKLSGHAHTLKAANDAERDGWYISIEKAIELGKASQEEVQSSEGYKAEAEKLSKPQVPAVAAAAAKPKEEKKARSTSRGGLFGRNKVAAEETEQKTADKEDKEEAKPEVEAAAATTAVAAGGVVVADAVVAEDKPTEAAAAETAEPTEAKAEDAPKASKRGSIFGKLSGWNVKSPAKEKDQKEAELKPEAPVDEAAAVETAEPAEAETALPTVEAPATEAAKEDVTTPNKEKSKFLSGFNFAKRGRSVSPSNVPKTEEAPAATEAAEPATVTAAEPAAVTAEEPAAEADATVVADAEDKPAEEAKTETTPTKRQSIFSNLGRRASKAFRGNQAPKTDAAAPATTEEAKEEATTASETAPVEVGGETKALEAEAAQSHIGDVVPEAVSVGQPEQSAPVVAASA